MKIKAKAASLLRRLGLIAPATKNLTVHEDEIFYRVDDDLIFQVYWKCLPIGRGPAVILNALNQEILKFDCFGEGMGHYHVAPYFNLRIFFAENSVDRQITQTIEILRSNGLKYLSLQNDPKIKNLKPDIEAYKEVLEKVEFTLRIHHAKVIEKFAKDS